MQAVFNAALPIFALILTGWVCARRRILGPAATDSLNDFVVFLALPAQLFQGMAQITWEQIDHPGFLAAFGGGMLVTYLLSFALDRRGARLCDRSIEGLDAAYPNTGFMGIPLCLVVFGAAALPVAVIATLLTACVMFAGSIVLIELDLQGERRLGRTLLKVARSLARNPVVIAPIAGLGVAASGFGLPGPLLRFTTLLGAAASPCALVTIGLFLAQTRGEGEGGKVARLVAMKLLLQPALTALLAFRVFEMPPLWAEGAVLLSAMPIGTGPFMLAKIYNREAGVTSRAILLSTLLSVITVSLLVARFGPG
jgi:malonate transporter and related proteins